MTRWSLAALLALLVACAGPPQDEPALLESTELVDALRSGGHVLLVRHTETSRGGIDSLTTLGDCTAQRPLTDRGRQDARVLGEALRQLAVPVGRVVASPFCRTVETAVLAFGETETDDALLALASVGDDGAPAQDRTLDAARALVLQPPPEEANTVLVGHVSTIGPLTGSSPAEGGTVVLRAVDGELVVVAEVPPGGWQELAAEVG